MQDYVNRIDYLDRQIDNLRSDKLDREHLSKETLELKRILKNFEVKIRKFLGISEEEWEGFVSKGTEEVDFVSLKPLSFKNEKLLQHITLTNYLRK